MTVPHPEMWYRMRTARIGPAPHIVVTMPAPEITPLPEAQQIAEGYPEARFVIVPGAPQVSPYRPSDSRQAELAAAR
jgi:hypothetical protein